MKAKDRKSKVRAQDMDDSLSPLAKAERLRRVRHLANLSREEFCLDGKFTIAALISWESGRFGGLSAKGAERVIARAAKEGVFVTPEWLLYEVGSGPVVRADYKKLQDSDEGTVINTRLPSENERIMQELMVFKRLNKQAIDFIVEDDAMLPHYKIGDYVAGTKRTGGKIRSLIGHDCIAQTLDGQVFMRHLQAGPRPQSFNLIPMNLRAGIPNAIIYDVELAAAAPIVWHRRKELV